MPELPEVELTARLLDGALGGASVESALAPGLNTLKTFAPPLAALEGHRLTRVRRRGKQLIVEFDGGLVLLLHLMSAGRLQLYDSHASSRDRTSRLLVRFIDGRELRLREFGTKQAAWAKLLEQDALASDEALARLGPEAWPEPPDDLGERLAQPRPLYAALRDQHVIAGIGRSWVDEILWTARISPFKRGADLDAAEVETLASAIRTTLGGALEQYERTLTLPLPDKLPMPLLVHRHAGEPCPRCAATLESVNFEDHVMSYCPHCQTEGRVLKDRRLSRLLK
ncbi:MAG TPA: DNA-formamidopyrimidine glycosylase family protein [Solirubrobacteraceae bacterium]|jgi:formamidopyrimidine-DNA glycosylase|nr:DNA-formamidopyrimidine glycosylase family protein [Solirubrobacteraceae bacterium]